MSKPARRTQFSLIERAAVESLFRSKPEVCLSHLRDAGLSCLAEYEPFYRMATSADPAEMNRAAHIAAIGLNMGIPLY